MLFNAAYAVAADAQLEGGCSSMRRMRSLRMHSWREDALQCGVCGRCGCTAGGRMLFNAVYAVAVDAQLEGGCSSMRCMRSLWMHSWREDALQCGVCGRCGCTAGGRMLFNAVYAVAVD